MFKANIRKCVNSTPEKCHSYSRKSCIVDRCINLHFSNNSKNRFTKVYIIFLTFAHEKTGYLLALPHCQSFSFKNCCMLHRHIILM